MSSFFAFFVEGHFHETKTVRPYTIVIFVSPIILIVSLSLYAVDLFDILACIFNYIVIFMFIKFARFLHKIDQRRKKDKE